MKNRTTRFLMISLTLVSAFCVFIFSIQTIWSNAMGAKAITDIGVIYMSGMSEQVATHFGTTIELRLSQVEALVDSVPPKRNNDESTARVALTYSARSRGFEYLAFYTADGEFDMIYGPRIESGMPKMFFQSLINGEEKVSAGWDAYGTPVVMMGVPVAYPLSNGETSVALIAGLPTSYLSDTLSLNVDSSMVDYSIIRRNGSIILQSENSEHYDNYFDLAESTYESTENKTLEQYISELTSAMDSGRDYTSEILVNGVRQNLYCTGLPDSEWYLLLYMSYGILDETIASMNKKWSIVSLGGCCLILGLLLLVFVGYFRLTRQQISDLDEARRTADKARRTAERASQVKSEFLSNMSHDIRTPMNGIMGMTSVAIAHLDNTPHVLSCLKKINISSQHLLGLINDMLDMSKIESGQLSLNAEPVSLREVIHNVITIIHPQIQEKSQRLNIYTESILCENVLSDNVRLAQILLNLLGNAVKFTSEQGNIQILLRQEPSPKGENYVRTHLYVEDDGIGIDTKFQQKIFDAFVREDAARVQKNVGAGLGLTITKHVIDAMQGAIEVESTLGQGTVFHVILDLEKTYVNEPDLILPSRNILLVTDDQRLKDIAAEILTAIGLNAHFASSTSQASMLIKKQNNHNDPYHIILLDWALSQNSCITLANEIHQLNSEIPLLLLFDGDWGEVETEARAAGIVGCITKPLFRSSLYYSLRKYAETVPPQPTEAKKEELIDFSGRRVLMAEDNELNWVIADELLSDLGLEMDWAENGQICVDKFQQSPIYWYDAILMDLRMPLVTGYEATQMIRKLDRSDAADIPIIAISADAFYDDIQRCLSCGMNAHTPKPIDVKEVARLLDQFIRHREHH